MHTDPACRTPGPDNESMPLEAVLDEYHQAMAHLSLLKPRRLSPGLRTLIWGLRVYVVFMAFVVVLNIVERLH